MAKSPPRSAARITSFVRAFLCKGFMEFPHPQAEAAKTDASYNKRQMMSLFRQKRKPRVFGGYEDPGWGYNRGGPEETRSCSVHLVHAEQTNFSQLFIREENLFLISCSLPAAQAGFAGNSAYFRFGNAEEHGRASPRYIFRYLAVHFLSPYAGSVAMESSSTAITIAL